MTIDAGADGDGPRRALPLWAPDSCTLPTAEQPFRMAEFEDLFAVAQVHRVTPERLRLLLPADPGIASRAADLAVRENACCSFFEFTLRVGGGTLEFEVAVPPQQVGLLDAIQAAHGAAAGASER